MIHQLPYQEAQTGLRNHQGERKLSWARDVILVETVGGQTDSTVWMCPWELITESSGMIQPRGLGREPWEGGVCISRDGVSVVGSRDWRD